jgi:hypothetical protein
LLTSWLPVSQNATHSEAARAAAIVIRAIEAQARLMGLLQGDMPTPTPEKPRQLTEDHLAKSPAMQEALERMLARAKAKQAAPKPVA